ncbi:hypothetical protein BOTBODRAFT_419711 [Botryobasidium botryosum FD-172 SS1]|uniref:Uncharacterized protein n=1 Tax=Botryobasidium botryosum (strain FD-172 SS1) TaxID=930990 RepID=A0A067MC60_BOTB1|nr:hypothetical protein BOTBODRAFT_419711 [Botryobasidium botryosum FD-172 SS1]
MPVGKASGVDTPIALGLCVTCSPRRTFGNPTNTSLVCLGTVKSADGQNLASSRRPLCYISATGRPRKRTTITTSNRTRASGAGWARAHGAAPCTWCTQPRGASRHCNGDLYVAYSQT